MGRRPIAEPIPGPADAAMDTGSSLQELTQQVERWHAWIAGIYVATSGTYDEWSAWKELQ